MPIDQAAACSFEETSKGSFHAAPTVSGMSILVMLVCMSVCMLVSVSMGVMRGRWILVG